MNYISEKVSLSLFYKLPFALFLINTTDLGIHSSVLHSVEQRSGFVAGISVKFQIDTP